MNNPSSEHDDDHRVVSFRRPGAPPRAPMTPPQPPVEDLGKYQQAPEESPEAYRHRMMVNLAAFAFIAVLIGGALWLADMMATMRRNQDCVLSGRRGCTPVEYTPQAR